MSCKLLPLVLVFATTALISCDSCYGDDDDDDDDAFVDSDGDGLSDDDEAELGTDPDNADSDADGLSDGEEVDLGTDPTVGDTDGDTYLDYDEIVEERDPLDPESRIYAGYWPYYRDKDTIVGTELDDTVQEDDVFGHFVGPDQYGDEVDLYDFAGQGKYTVIDLSGMWCYYCAEMAKYLSDQASFFDDFEGYYPLEDLRDLVADNTIQWVTILDANAMSNPITQGGLEVWHEKYEHEYIAIMGDMDGVLASHMNVIGYPTLLLVDDQMNVVTYNANDYMEVIVDVVDLAGQM